MAMPGQTVGTQAMPKFQQPFVDAEGRLALPWQRVLLNIWLKTGGSNSIVSGLVYISEVAGTSDQLEAFDVQTGQSLGVLLLNATVGGPAQPQELTLSPFIFTSEVDGTLTSKTGEMELSRDDGTTWYPFSVTGGAIHLKRADLIRVTWFGSAAPQVTFFPD